MEPQKGDYLFQDQWFLSGQSRLELEITALLNILWASEHHYLTSNLEQTS